MSGVRRPSVLRHAAPSNQVLLGFVVTVTLAASACAPAPSVRGSGDARSTTAPPTVTAPDPSTGSATPEAGSVHPVTTVVITDDPAVAAGAATQEGTWVGHLAVGLQQAGAPVSMTTAADTTAGFATTPPGGTSFTDLVGRHVQHATQLVIFFETDLTADGATVAEGALQAFNAVERAAPDGRVVVVSPYRNASSATEPPAEVLQALRDAGDRAEVVVEYIDPEGWPAGLDGTEFADLLQPHLVELVTALSRSGAFE